PVRESALLLRRPCACNRLVAWPTCSKGLRPCCAIWRDKIKGLGVSMFQKIAVMTVLLFSFLAVSAQAQTQANTFQGPKNIESIVAWVNSDIILKSEYDKRIDEIRGEITRSSKLQGAQLDQAIKEQSKHALRELIDEALYRQQAKELGITGELEVLKALERMRQERKLDSQEALEKEITSQGYTVDEVKENLRSQVFREQV